MTKWRIYEMLKRICSINYAVLYRARKKDLIEAIVEYIRSNGK